MKKSIKTVGFMFLMILLSKILGQAREMLIAQFYGSSGDAAAFYAASALPLNLFDIVFASAVSSAFIPVYNTYLERDGVREGDRFASAFINALLIGSVLLTGILMLASSGLISVVAGGLVGEVRATAIHLTVVMLPVIVFASMAFSFVGLLQSKGEFNIPAIMSLVSNGIIILYLCCFNRYFGINGLAVSLVIGWLLQFAIQIPVAVKKGFHYQPVLRHEGLKTVVKLALPVMVGTWIQPISAIINNAFASGIGNANAIPTLNWANKLYLIVSSVFTVSLTNYIFPKLSRQSVQEDAASYKETLKVSFMLIVGALIPICMLMLAFKTPIIEIVYKRGAFTDEDLYLTAGAFFYYSLGIPFYGLLDLLNKAYYARKNMLVPSLTAAAAIVLNIVLSFLLKNVMGSFGLALSTSLTAVFMSAVLFLLLNRELGFLEKKDYRQLTGFVLYGVLMLPVCLLCYHVFPGKDFLIGNILAVGVSALAGLLVYGICLYCFRPEIRNLIQKGMKKTMTQLLELFRHSRLYALIRRIYLFFLIPFRETFVYKLFMTDIGTKSWEGSMMFRLIERIRGLLSLLNRAVVGSVTYRVLHKLFCKTTVSDIMDGSRILRWFRISSEGYSFAFLIFLLLLFAAGILPTMAVVALTLLTLVFSFFETDFQKNLAKTKPIFTDVLIGLYLISLLWGLFLSVDPGKYQIFLVYFVFVGLYYGVRYFVSTERRLILSISYFTLSGICVCGYGFLQYITGSYETTTWTDTQLFSDISGRIYATFQNPNVFGEYLLFLIPLALAMFLIAKKALHKIVYGGCLLASVLCLILTYSRGCWLGLIAGMGLFLLLLYKKTLIPLFFAAPFSIFVIPDHILNRFMSIGNLKDGSTAFRVYVWRGTVKMLEKLWPTGAGLGNYSFEVAYAPFAYAGIMAPHSHSLYFHLLSETGIFGFLAFVFLAYFTLRQLFMVYKHPKNREMQILAIALVSGFVSFLIQGFFDNTFYNYRMYMLFFALISLAASLYAVGGEKVS